MSTVTALLTHLDAARVHETVALLRLAIPDAQVVICHGGRRDEFERIEIEPKLFIDDPTLRGPERHLQSWTQIFEKAYYAHVEPDPDVDSLYLCEFDHLILDPEFEVRLRDLAAATGADFLGKNCVDRTATNWEHYVRFRHDARLSAHLRSLSVRADSARLYGCLGNGMWLSRRALEAYVGVHRHPPCYCETYVPTVLHHLGFNVVDVDAHSDLYRYVRWIPSFSREDALAAARAGAAFVHPVKDPEVVRAVAEWAAGRTPATRGPVLDGLPPALPRAHQGAG